jgi:hypothetical protein
MLGRVSAGVASQMFVSPDTRGERPGLLLQQGGFMASSCLGLCRAFLTAALRMSLHNAHYSLYKPRCERHVWRCVRDQMP